MKITKNKTNGYTLVEILILIVCLLTFTGIGVGLYVVYHFISKYW